MNNHQLAFYALQRQRIALERTLYADTDAACQAAAKWAGAWHRLVQVHLGPVEPVKPVPSWNRAISLRPQPAWH